MREIYTFVMQLCTGHCNLSSKIMVTKSPSLSDVCKIIMSHFSVITLPLHILAVLSLAVANGVMSDELEPNLHLDRLSV